VLAILFLISMDSYQIWRWDATLTPDAAETAKVATDAWVLAGQWVRNSLNPEPVRTSSGFRNNLYDDIIKSFWANDTVVYEHNCIIDFICTT
jgi:hypothetical protein